MVAEVVEAVLTIGVVLVAVVEVLEALAHKGLLVEAQQQSLAATQLLKVHPQEVRLLVVVLEVVGATLMVSMLSTAEAEEQAATMTILELVPLVVLRYSELEVAVQDAVTGERVQQGQVVHGVVIPLVAEALVQVVME